MVDDTVSLDSHRGMAAQKATDLRRLRLEVEEDHAALRERQEKLEAFLLLAPAENWPEAVEKARYLLGLFVQTLSGDDTRRHKLVKAVLDDFERMLKPS